MKELNHTMWLIISLASAMEAGVKLIASQDKINFISESLVMSNNALEAALASINEPILTIDRKGTIMNGNTKASTLLKLAPENYGEINLLDFLPAQSKLLAVINNNQTSNLEENISVGNHKQRYTINIRPIPGPKSSDQSMAILKLAPADRTPNTANSGSPARFRFDDIIGQSKAIKQTIESGKRFAGTSETILLIGESGTGKELFAQAIHNQYRPNGPFMAVNCAAMPKNLIESELFGYEGGSFTGADRVGRPGKIELANGGTLFLDEIGDMPLEIQAVLLRVLEDKQVTRIGAKQSKSVDFRVIAATNRNLYEMVKDKTFREDLYFRLSVLPINLPPLRIRGNDALLLSRFFIEDYCKRNGFNITDISPEAQKLILKYTWPGNVRQLQNAIYYAVNTAQNDVIEPHNLPEFILFDSSPEITGVTATTGEMGGGEPLSIKKLEKAAIDLALLQSHNSIPRAAEMLGMSKATLYRKLKEYNTEQ
jgi:transcriptional regulator with PAS, ATPase and Fis domain